MSSIEKPILQLQNVTKRFGGVVAVSDLTLTMKPSEILGLIGPNGAGKTTVFNLITGVFSLTSGSIAFNGHNINGLQPHRITQHGISRTFQNIRLFESMTVLEHVKFGQNLYSHVGLRSLVTAGGSSEKFINIKSCQ